MAKFNLDDYEPVQSRIPKFLEKYENPRIITHLASNPDCVDTCVFVAKLFSGDTLLSTGWAFEREGDGYVNKTSHLENCETSAIGRALANLGLHGDKRPSREEMEKVERGPQQKKEEIKHPEDIEHFKDRCKKLKIDWEDFLGVVSTDHNKNQSYGANVGIMLHKHREAIDESLNKDPSKYELMPF